MVNNREYFICYSTNVFKFLKLDNKINYICYGLHEKTLQKFWLFKIDSELKAALDKYKQNGIEKGLVKE
jgi:hypothetical protein